MRHVARCRASVSRVPQGLGFLRRVGRGSGHLDGRGAARKRRGKGISPAPPFFFIGLTQTQRIRIAGNLIFFMLYNNPALQIDINVNRGTTRIQLDRP